MPDPTTRIPRIAFVLLAAVLLCAARQTGAAPHERPNAPHPRIVSFSPGITRILFDLGLGDHVVGVTNWCILPEGIERPRVGDALAADSDAILKLAPDLIITQPDPSRFAGVHAVEPGIRIVQLDIMSLENIAAAIETIAALAGRPELGKQRRAGFEAEIAYVREKVAGLDRPRVVFVMGTDRPTVAGAGCYVSDLIEAAGGVNAGAEIARGTWISTHLDAIRAVGPDVLICQGEMGRETADRTYWLRNASDTPAVRAGRVHVVADRNWSIPSTRTPKQGLAFAKLIHPEVFADAPEPSGPRTKGMPAWLVMVLRLAAAGVVGAGLAVGGAALQGLLRNPLAEPYVLGISSGAGVGVLLGMAVTAWTEVAVAGGSTRVVIPEWVSTPVLAFAGALVTCAAVYLVAQRRGRLDPYSLILSGVIVNTFNGAIMLTILLYLDPYRIADFSRWAMGRMPDAVSPGLLAASTGCVALGWGVLMTRAKAFDVLGLGDEVAASSGIRVHGLRLLTFICVGLMTAAAVALAGPIGFLGLIVPHICRMVVGPGHRRLMLVSGIAGAVFLVAAEVLCRRGGPMIGVGLIPVGIVTALAGGPFFIVLLRRGFREERQ